MRRGVGFIELTTVQMRRNVEREHACMTAALRRMRALSRLTKFHCMRDSRVAQRVHAHRQVHCW